MQNILYHYIIISLCNRVFKVCTATLRFNTPVTMFDDVEIFTTFLRTAIP